MPQLCAEMGCFGRAASEVGHLKVGKPTSSVDAKRKWQMIMMTCFHGMLLILALLPCWGWGWGLIMFCWTMEESDCSTMGLKLPVALPSLEEQVMLAVNRGGEKEEEKQVTFIANFNASRSGTYWTPSVFSPGTLLTASQAHPYCAYCSFTDWFYFLLRWVFWQGWIFNLFAFFFPPPEPPSGILHLSKKLKRQRALECSIKLWGLIMPFPSSGGLLLCCFLLRKEVPVS